MLRIFKRKIAFESFRFAVLFEPFPSFFWSERLDALAPTPLTGANLLTVRGFCSTSPMEKPIALRCDVKVFVLPVEVAAGEAIIIVCNMISSIGIVPLSVDDLLHQMTPLLVMSILQAWLAYDSVSGLRLKEATTSVFPERKTILYSLIAYGIV